ncbi:hypothetical protein BU26DRAFT_569390 [Trematosphaeria pertusa]|uniref:Uncharacterized protein n=1 Tax=Trematosphaeria pertusa TaxID=390896 RepID=A0A6A6I2A4_9PLEO|nr:uncharacterized protein BU26DRAFT_569390 [Trematosphaeria pertusa]KAF2244407.1 hypothetical protein BU26DRAFT_569390 [Trematosphaeria pertusa]
MRPWKKPQEEPYQEDYKRDISVELNAAPYPRRRGTAKLDTYHEYDFMHPRFASQLGLSIGFVAVDTIESSLTNETIPVLGKADVRWFCEQKGVPATKRFDLAPRYEDGVFWVTYAAGEFDVVVGRSTIERVGLVDRKGRLIIPRSRSLPPQVNKDRLDAEQAKEERRRQEEEARRREQEGRVELGASIFTGPNTWADNPYPI